MSRKLEAALAAEQKAAERRAAIERHEKLVALSVQCTKHLRAKDYASAYDATLEMVSELVSAEQAQKES